jgi:hypothetical protein
MAGKARARKRRVSGSARRHQGCARFASRCAPLTAAARSPVGAGMRPRAPSARACVWGIPVGTPARIYVRNNSTTQPSSAPPLLVHRAHCSLMVCAGCLSLAASRPVRIVLPTTEAVARHDK